MVGIVLTLPTPQGSMLPNELLRITYWGVLLQCLQCKSKKVKNKTVYYEETMESQHLIFWPGSQEGPLLHCKIGAESEGNNQPGPLASAICKWHILQSILSNKLINKETIIQTNAKWSQSLIPYAQLHLWDSVLKELVINSPPLHPSALTLSSWHGCKKHASLYKHKRTSVSVITAFTVVKTSHLNKRKNTFLSFNETTHSALLNYHINLVNFTNKYTYRQLSIIWGQINWFAE
jgi:hypothetical protein